jgi:hypothetical protein
MDMPVTKVRSQWVAGNLEYVKASDRTKVGGVPAISGSTTKAGGTLAVPITHRFVTMTTGGVEALTLANGVPGQLITITLGTDGGDGTLTPATKTGFATIVFAAAKDTATLQYVDDTIGWVLIGYYGTATVPVVS